MTKGPRVDDESLYAKLKKRYGQSQKAITSPSQPLGQDVKIEKKDSELIRLTCFDFKVTEPLGMESGTNETVNKSIPWWKACLWCSLLPDDDPQSQIFRFQHEKQKSKHPKKTRTFPPGPIAEGLEDASQPPTILSTIPSERRSFRQSFLTSF